MKRSFFGSGFAYAVACVVSLTLGGFGIGDGVAAAASSVPLKGELITETVSQPIFVTHAPDDFERIFILERIGRIRIHTNDALLPASFLDLTADVSVSGEGGLLGLAFHPDYACNGLFYVNYTVSGGKGFSQTTIVSEFSVSEADPNVADAGSERVLLSFGQPASNHNGGWIGFGPADDFLYIASGDGGVIGPGPQRAQELTNQRLGKMLRIDVNGDDFPGDPERNYAIPADNPFVGRAGDDEIWSYGLRNPFRCAFDRETADLWIGDVGEETWEEIDFQPASSPGGENYGWGCMEGLDCNADTFCVCPSPDLTAPVHQYDHASGCAIGGIAMYRGCAMPELQGTLFFGDFCQNKVWSLRYVDGQVTELLQRIDELQPKGPPIFWNVVAIGEDAFGELYVCHLGGQVWKIVPADPPADEDGDGVPDSCETQDVVGDLDGDGIVGFADLLLLLNGWGPCGTCVADIDDNGVVDFQDLLLLLFNWS